MIVGVVMVVLFFYSVLHSVWSGLICGQRPPWHIRYLGVRTLSMAKTEMLWTAGLTPPPCCLPSLTPRPGSSACWSLPCCPGSQGTGPPPGETACQLVTASVENITFRLAATICQLLLWAPSSWYRGGECRPPGRGECGRWGENYVCVFKGTQDILQWLLTMTTKVVCESRFLEFVVF